MLEDLTGCSFCGKVCPDVRYMIQGPLVTICDECVFLCVKILGELGIVDAEGVVEAPPWFDTCQTLDCQAWPTWRVLDANDRVVRGSYNCDEHRPQEQPTALGERYEHRQPLRPSK